MGAQKAEQFITQQLDFQLRVLKKHIYLVHTLMAAMKKMTVCMNDKSSEPPQECSAVDCPGVS